LTRFEGRSSLRTWLYRIATNACLKTIERRPKRVLPIDYGPPAEPHTAPAEPLSESVWIEPYIDEPEASYEQHESVELAFVAALQHLPPTQRAALILRDVLGFPVGQIAEMLETTPTAVYSSLQRAHRAVSERLPHPSQQATLRALGDQALSQMVSRYVDAWQRGDVDAIVKMLTEDAVFAMPPMPTWFIGPFAIGAFLRERVIVPANRWRVVPARANGQVAFGYYLWDEPAATYRLHNLSVVTVRGAQIAELTSFLSPEYLGRSGLPAEMPR
jgi:RNA polymerase sigma-70 factor (ECF subfamily)